MSVSSVETESKLQRSGSFHPASLAERQIRSDVIELRQELRNYMQSNAQVLKELREEIDKLRQKQATMTQVSAKGVPEDYSLEGEQAVSATKKNDLQYSSNNVGRKIDDVDAPVKSIEEEAELKARMREMFSKAVVDGSLKVAIASKDSSSRLNDDPDRANERMNTLQEAQIQQHRSQEDKPMDEPAAITSFLKDEFDAIIESYEMKESVWEVTFLIGFPCITCPSILVVSALINALVQFFICMVVFTNMVDGEGFDDSVKHSLEHWRLWVGHWHGNGDSDTRTSLMAKMCGQDFTTFIGATQFALYGDVSLFLNADGNFFNGVMLSYIAVACWLVLVLDDLREIISLHIAIHRVPRGPPQIDWSDDDALKVRSYSNLQFFLVSFFVFVPRAFITLFLAFTGCLFLGRTSNVGELLLNTTALSFVLDLDTLFWHLLIPYRAKAVVSKLSPFEHPAFSFVSFVRDRIGGFFMYLSIIILLACLLLVHFTVLHPFHEDVRAIEKVLCGGNVNFVWDIDPVNGNLLVRSSNPLRTADPPVPHTPRVSKLLSYAFDTVISTNLVEAGQWGGD